MKKYLTNHKIEHKISLVGGYRDFNKVKKYNKI